MRVEASRSRAGSEHPGHLHQKLYDQECRSTARREANGAAMQVKHRFLSKCPVFGSDKTEDCQGISGMKPVVWMRRSIR